MMIDFTMPGHPGTGSADREAMSGPKLAFESQQKADCDEYKLRLVRVGVELQRRDLTARKRKGSLLASLLSAPNVRRPTTSLQRVLNGGVKTDAEGFIRNSYNDGRSLRGEASRKFHVWDTNGTLTMGTKSQSVEIAHNLRAHNALHRPYERA
jgi:hypothetical protein